MSEHDELTLEALHIAYEKLRSELQPLVGYFMAKEDIDNLKVEIEKRHEPIKDKAMPIIPGLFCIYGLSIIESKFAEPGCPIPFGHKDGRIVPLFTKDFTTAARRGGE